LKHPVTAFYPSKLPPGLYSCRAKWFSGLGVADASSAFFSGCRRVAGDPETEPSGEDKSPVTAQRFLTQLASESAYN
jgi:hypothetical protein